MITQFFRKYTHLIASLLLLTFMIQGNSAAISQTSNLNNNSSAAWANIVVHSNIFGVNNRFTDPAQALGEPNYSNSPQSGFVSLGGGELIVDLGEGEHAIDGSGPDLRVYNPGTGAGESFSVYGSNHYPAESWVFLGPFSGNGVAKFDIGLFGLSSVRYVRIVDTSTTGLSGQSPGTDIDYVAAVHFIDSPYANNVVFHLTTGSNNQYQDPLEALGPPDYVDSIQAGFISLGPGGELILDMGAGEEITDGPGNDIRVVNPGSDGGEIADIYISNSPNSDWVFVGKALGSRKINEFDISFTGLLSARYLRIVDVSTGDLIDENPATDIDYVETLYLPDSVKRIRIPLVVK